MSNTTKLESVQALRGFAALYVFTFHAKIPLPLWSEDASATLLHITNNGFMGVDIFFVISGFIMAWVAAMRSNDGPLAFALKRFFRVAPPYWIATCVTLYLLVTGNTSDGLLKSLMFYPLSSHGGPFYGYALLNTGWTLNYEMLFYALFCASLLFGRYSLIALVIAICGLVFGFPILSGDGFSVDVTRQLSVSEPYLMLATNPILLEFVLGIGCAVIYSKLRGKTPKVVAAVLLALGISLMAWTTTRDGINSGIEVGIPAAVLLLGSLLSEDSGLLRVPRFASWLGEISFSFYLVHAAIVQLVRYKVPPPLGSAGTYGQMLFELGIILLVASCWHRFIETPSARLGISLAGRLSLLTKDLRPKRRVARDRLPGDRLNGGDSRRGVNVGLQSSAPLKRDPPLREHNKVQTLEVGKRESDE
jgi:peptidoglycan/LPS O-acetylase OafA/YrhL